MPAAPTAPPPIAAPSTPAAPAAPPKTSGPAPMDRAEPTDSSWLAEAGAELEDLDRQTNQPRPPRPAQGPTKPKPADEPQKPTAADPQQATEDDVINPGDEPEHRAKPPVDPNAPPERPLKAPELRKAYEDQKKRITEELEPEVTRLRSRVQELEQAGPKDTEQTAQRVKTLEDQNKQLLDFVKRKYYEQHPEFKDGVKANYEKAWEKCLRDISQLEVDVADGKGGYMTRKASDADITYLASLPLGELIKQTNAMFGDAADVVRGHVQEINRTWEAQSKALEDWEKRSGELSKKEADERQEDGRIREKLWVDYNTELATKHQTYFAPIQGDESGNKLLNAGFAFADLLFSNQMTPDKIALLPEKFRTELQTKGKLSRELKVRADAIIRNKAANHDRLARSLRIERAAHEETKKKLAAYEESEPPAGGSQPGRNGSATGGHWQDPYNAEIDELDRKGR